MGRLVFLAIFIGIPLIEIALFIVVGERIGLLWTVAIVILTAIAGTSLLRAQGRGALEQARRAADEGRVPVESVADGVFLLIAGILLLTPGFLTDFVGFLLFIPTLRHTVGRTIWQKLMASGMIDIRSAPGRNPGPGADQRPTGSSKGPVIEGEVVDEADEPNASDREPVKGGPLNPDSPWRAD